MLNSEIKYKTSTDYEELYQLLKSGNLIIGFIALDIKGVPNMEYSKLVQMSYNENFKSFDLGFTFFESDFDKIGFDELCLKYNLRFITLNSDGCLEIALSKLYNRRLEYEYQIENHPEDSIERIVVDCQFNTIYEAECIVRDVLTAP